MMKVAISRRSWISQEQLYELSKSDYEVVFFKDKLPKAFNIFVGYPEILRDNFQKITSEVKYIHLLSAGYDKLEVIKLLDMGIRITNSKGVYSIPIAEYVVSKILSDAKCEELFRKQQEESKWFRHKGLKEMSNQVVGFLGTGDIAQKTAQYLKIFGTKVLGLNTNGHDQFYFDETFSMQEIDKFLPNCDYVVDTLPLNTATEYLMTKDCFLAMKKDAVFINVGRGKTVNERDLKDILDYHLRKVYADVFENEPLEKNSWQWQHPKFFVTPHISFSSKEAESRKRDLALHNLIQYVNNRELTSELQKRGEKAIEV